MASSRPGWPSVSRSGSPSRVAALLFGVGHWLSSSYAALAALIGAYLGLVFLLTDNLLVPDDRARGVRRRGALRARPAHAAGPG